jgi:hypothetical protein
MNPNISMKRIGFFLTAALVLGFLTAVAPAGRSEASDVKAAACWSYETSAARATHHDNGTPILYWNDDPVTVRLGMGLNTCENYILLKWSRIVCFEGCDPGMYYQFDWRRKGLDEWQVFTVHNNVLRASTWYATQRFNHAHRGAWYEFAVTVCTDRYGCTHRWSPTVTIRT